jgi:hypothetical protein
VKDEGMSFDWHSTIGVDWPHLPGQHQGTNEVRHQLICQGLAMAYSDEHSRRCWLKTRNININNRVFLVASTGRRTESDSSVSLLLSLPGVSDSKESLTTLRPLYAWLNSSSTSSRAVSIHAGCHFCSWKYFNLYLGCRT